MKAVWILGPSEYYYSKNELYINLKKIKAYVSDVAKSFVSLEFSVT